MRPWEKEHGKDFDVPSVVQYLVKNGVLEDISWHNDAAPSFLIQDPTNPERGIRLWVDHPIKSMREFEGNRFLVQLGETSSEAEHEQSEVELEEALRWIMVNARLPEFEKAKIRQQKWWDDGLEPVELVDEFLREYRRKGA